MPIDYSGVDLELNESSRDDGLVKRIESLEKKLVSVEGKITGPKRGQLVWLFIISGIVLALVGVVLVGFSLHFLYIHAHSSSPDALLGAVYLAPMAVGALLAYASACVFKLLAFGR